MRKEIVIITDKDLDGVISAKIFLDKIKAQYNNIPIIFRTEKIKIEAKLGIFLDISLNRIIDFLENTKSYFKKICIYDHHICHKDYLEKLKKYVDNLELFINSDALSTSKILDKKNGLYASITDNPEKFVNRIQEDILYDILIRNTLVQSAEKDKLREIIFSSSSVPGIIEKIKNVFSEEYGDLKNIAYGFIESVKNFEILFLGEEDGKRELIIRLLERILVVKFGEVIIYTYDLRERKFKFRIRLNEEKINKIKKEIEKITKVYGRKSVIVFYTDKNLLDVILKILEK